MITFKYTKDGLEIIRVIFVKEESDLKEVEGGIL